MKHSFSTYINDLGFGGGAGGIAGGPAYKPVEVREQTGASPMLYLHVCAMDSYKNFGLDFLRWQEYKKGGPSSSTSPVSSFSTPSSTPSFGNQNNNSAPSFSFGGGGGNTPSFGNNQSQNTSCIFFSFS
jgi:hypothetical protein